MLKETDTICAPATPAGGAIGVVRVSGEKTLTLVDHVFRGKHPLTEAAAGTLHFGEVVDAQGETVDQVVASVWRAPHSYTGEDCVELSCHGSRYIMQQLVQTLIDAGCRMARPGEYTERAYLNGKMDLSQAEAVADIVAASNKATQRMALSQLKGGFSNELSALRDQLLKLTSLLELELDFSDHEELEFANRGELLELAETIDERITRLAKSFKTGQALKQGIAVAIVGKTNVGKSTLLNQLLHEDKAIVSDIHGTTRDVIEDTTEIHGVTFRFIDTAGIRHTDDQVERLGIERTFKKLDEAAIVVWLLDAVPSAAERSDMQNRCQGKKLLMVWNKCDLQPSLLPSALSISAKKGLGIDTLQDALFQAADIPEIRENDVIVTSARHYESLIRAHESLQRVLSGLHTSLSSDLIAEDLRICLDQLADITGGGITPAEVLSNIFSHFCIGK